MNQRMNNDYPPPERIALPPNSNELPAAVIGDCVEQYCDVQHEGRLHSAQKVIIPDSASNSCCAYWIRESIREAIYGEVWSGCILRRLPGKDGSPLKWESTSTKVAIKTMSLLAMRSGIGSAEDPYKEIAVMQYLREYLLEGEDMTGLSKMEMRERTVERMLECHLVISIDVLSDNTNMFIVMPLCDGGDLYDRLECRLINEGEARFWLTQLLCALETLLNAELCHGDLSLENVVTAKEGGAYLIDFGQSLKIPYIEENGTRQRCLIQCGNMCGKIYCRSPEIQMKRESFDGHTIDLWALGPMLYTMVTGEYPWNYADDRLDPFFQCYSGGGFTRDKLNIPSHIETSLSDDFIDLLQQMFWLNPEHRLTLQGVRNHRWMNGPCTPPPILE